MCFGSDAHDRRAKAHDYRPQDGQSFERGSVGRGKNNGGKSLIEFKTLCFDRVFVFLKSAFNSQRVGITITSTARLRK